MKHGTRAILVFVAGMLFSVGAMAQEYGLELGFHQTSASTSASGDSVSGLLNFDGGLAVEFELMPQAKFRTGLLYNQRHFKIKDASGNATTYEFEYLDVPVNVQYNFNEMFGVFGGLVVGINTSDKTSPAMPAGTDLGTTKLLPLFDVGVNLTFQDMVGFDLYYERGSGDIAKSVSDFNTFGGNFIYWF